MRWLACFFVSLTLVACGGGGSGGSSATGGSATSSGAVSLSGVAAVGNAISGRISLVDATGHDRYVDTADGRFSFNLDGVKAPVMLKAQWSDASGSHRLYSFASADGVANISPLTHVAVIAAVGTLGTVSADTLYASPSATAFAALQNALPGAISRLQTSLQALMQRYAVSSANPITYNFLPNHTGMDALLDNITVSVTADTVTLTDKATGAILLAAPAGNLSQAVTSANWSPVDAVRAADIDVAIDSNGMGLVAWSELVNGHYMVKARLMGGTGSEGALSTAGDASAPRVAFDAAGNALAIWAQYSNSRNTIWGNHYSAVSRQWGTSRMLSSDTLASAIQPDLAMDQAGNGIAVWHQDDGSGKHSDGWAVQYAAPDASWSTPVKVSDGVNSAHGLRIAISPEGQGLVAWQQHRGDSDPVVSRPQDIAARSISTQGPWGATRIVSASGGTINTAYVYGHLALSVNAAGAGALLWSQRLLPSSPMVIEASMLTPGGGWQSATAISIPSTEDCHDPEVALDAAGNALAVWQQQTDYGAYGGSNRYEAATGWGTAGNFVDSKLGDAFAPSVAMDGTGNATVVWYRWSATNAIDLMINRYVPRSGWQGAQQFSPVGTDAAMTRSLPLVVANDKGQTLVVWGVNLSAVASWL